jgi:phage terminase large subunit-like protein
VTDAAIWAHSGQRKRVPDKSDGPWIGWRETDRAERAIRFIETYCRPAKGYTAGQLLRLAPFQTDWLRDVLRPGVSSAIMGIPRGNGKSSLLAALATWALFDPDESGAPQVPIVATAVFQAVRSVYGVAVAMIEAEPALAERSIRYTALTAQKTTCPMTGGEMFPTSNAIDHLQGLDPSLAVCDEIGFMSMDSWNSLLLAGVKRPRSLVVGIGTPGLDKDNALWHLRSLHHAGTPLPGFVFTEHAATPECRIDDEDEWHLANPALEGGFLNIESMRTNLGLAPEGRFRIFHLGQWVDGVESWLGDDGRKLWDALAAPAPQRPLEGPLPRIWVGLDVGVKRDSTALVVVQRLPRGLYATARFWMPKDGQAVEVTHVMQALRDLDRDYDIAEVAYDPRLFEVPAMMLADEGLPMVEFNQSSERMTPAFGQLFEMIKRGELAHDGDKMFATQVLNAVPRYNDRGFTLGKAKARGKIDACYALAMAVDRALHARPPRPKLAVL